jgi:pimeloyl-ACP methyl ester carboxylesterase
VLTETDLELAGRTLHAYDTAPDGGDLLPVFWHHGTPNTGEPPEPLLPAAAERGIRWVSYDRPGYGRSTPHPGRDAASAAADVAGIADALGIDRFAVMGHSGGCPHALACAALLPARVLAAVCVASMAPIDADGVDWHAGKAPSAAAKLQAASNGRAALEEYLADSVWDPEEFTPADHAALAGEWGWLGAIAGKALEAGDEGMIEDELVYVVPWGFDVRQIEAPVLFVHGGQDRVAPAAYAQWLARHCRSAELWLRPDDGHISVLATGVATLDWLSNHARQG